MNMNDRTQTKPWPLYIIMAMVACVFIAGYILSPKTEQQKLAWIEFLGTTNKGILLNPPVAVTDGQILDKSGAVWAPMDDSTWKILVVNPGICELACVNRLTELHAMRIRMNRDANRLTIGLLTSTGQDLATELQAYEDINVTTFADTELPLILEQTNMPSLDKGPAVLLMNPIDVIMMAYAPSHTGVDILADFNHLLDLAH